jgi:flagellar biosynthesis GTPase FlhF
LDIEHAGTGCLFQKDGFIFSAASHFVFDGGLGKGQKKPAMNLKRWFVWLCLAVVVVSEAMLFRANHQLTAAVVARDTAQHDADKARQDLEQFKSFVAATQGTEGDRLRSENQNLAQAVTQLKSETNRLRQANQQLTRQLAAVGQTAQQQQAQLQQWQAASQQARAVAQQSQSQAQSQAVIERNACIANLKLIDAAKLQWALLNNKTEDAIPTAQDLLPYFKDGIVPVCPSGGTYTINAVGQAPTCSIPGHALPQ